MSPARTTGQRRANREQRRHQMSQRLLRGLGSLAASGDSFASASVERLATAAGVGRSTFYVYFQDKTELLESWHAPIAAEFNDVAAAWTMIDRHVTREKLKDILTKVVQMHRNHALALPIIMEAATYDPVIKDAFDESLQRSITTLSKQIRLGQQEGWISKDIRVPETTTWLVFMTHRGASEMVNFDDAKQSSLIDTYAEVMHAALFKAPANRLSAGAAEQTAPA